MFHKATKSLAKQLDPDGSFIPIRCPVDEKDFRPLCLLQRKTKSPWWQSNPYHKTEYRLQDILLSRDHTAALINLDVQDSGLVTFVDKVDGMMQGHLGGPVDLTTITLMGLTSMTQTRSVKVKKVHISSRDLHSITKERKVNMCHEFIKQSKKFKRNLYVINEAIETVEETQFEESSKTEGSISSEANIKVKVNGARESKKTIIIPRDCVLAFRAKQLQIKEGSLEISDYQSNKIETFAKIAMQTDDAELVVSIDKRNNLQREVKEECMALSCLSADLRGKFLSGFVAIMQKNDLLHDLESQLDQALDSQYKLKADRPELQELVGNLQDSSGALITQLSESVLYFLEALNELTESQLLLLADSVEKRIVSKQLALVESILHNGSGDKEWKFTVDPQKLSEEDLNTTGEMIAMSGVTVQKTETCLAGTGNSAAFPALSALYVALFALNLLLAS
ncbi:gasdermin-A-like [Tiliqua scincoides]|uniref:gasdermin-A-like n=1 Tax=Tiliqua scincoides TaxID=71010 RepID=UPI003461FDF1